MKVIQNVKKRIAMICSAVMAFTMVTGFALLDSVNASAATPTSSVTLTGEIAKVAYTADELEALGLTDKSWISDGKVVSSPELITLYSQAFAKSSLKYYTSSFHYGSVRNYEYYKWLEAFPNGGDRGVMSYSAINGLSAGYWNGSEFGFKSTGTYTICEMNGSNSVWAIGWTAPADGTLVVPAASLTINSATNATLEMAWTAGDYLKAKSTEGWTEYTATTTVAEQTFEVTEGDCIYLSLRAAGTENNRKVNITYNPTFNFYEGSAEVEEGVTVTSLKKEIAKIQSIETMGEDTVLDFYGGVKWMGPYGQRNYAAMYGDANAGFLNYSNVNGVCPATFAGNNTAFRSTGTHTVGVLAGADVDRTWAIGYTAPKKGTVIIPSQTLTVAAASNSLNYEATYNANLSMGFSKGAANRTTMAPTDASLNWQTYEAGKTYTIPEQKFYVNAGDVIYVNLYAAKANEDVGEVERCVTFTYDLSFKFVEPEEINGISFEKETMYDTTKKLPSVPLTLETEIYVPSSIADTERGGVMFGNYRASGSCFNFEIKDKGTVRLYYTNTNNTISEIIFKTDVRQDKWLHVAVTYDVENAKWTCYIDGVAFGTVSYMANPIAPAALEKEFRLGGDIRSGNTSYFKGYMRSFAVYSDMRTAEEILADTKNVDATDANLLAYYKTPTNVATTDIQDLSANENHLNCVATWIQNKQEVTGYSYSFAVVGDTQKITDYDINHGTTYLSNIYDWILANKDSKKIEHVFGLGDITEWSNVGEWSYVKSVISKMDGEVPYSLIRGNHDTSARMSEAFWYDAYTKQFGGFYEEGSVLNSWMTFTAGKTDYLLVTLDFGPSDAVLAWANDVIASFPERRVIITTHAYLDANGNKNTLTDSNFNTLDYDIDKGFVASGSKDYNNGLEIWNKLVSKHANIFLVMGGHDPCSDVLVRKSTGIHGNTVTEMLIDPQDMDKTMSPIGMVAMLYFSEDGSEIEVEWYSTVKNAYYKENNQFSIELDQTNVDIHTFNKKNIASEYLKSTATCTTKETYYYSCVCGAKGTETFEVGDFVHTHNQTNTDAKYLKSEATCSAKAVYYYSCECGTIGTETFESGEMLAHNYDQINTDAKYLKSAATCTSKAVYYYSCECGAIGTETFENGEVLAHEYGEWVVVKEPTTTETGLKERTCSCGDKETEEIPVLPDDSSNTNDNSSNSGSADDSSDGSSNILSGCKSSVSGLSIGAMAVFGALVGLLKKRRED